MYCSILNMVAFSIVYFFSKDSNLIMGFIMYNITQVALNYLFHDNTKKNINTLVIDDGRNLEKIKCIIRHSPHYNFIGYVNPTPADDSARYLGDIEDIAKIVQEHDIHQVIFSKNKIIKKSADLLIRVKLHGVKMVDYFSFLEQAEGKIDTDKIDSVWVLMTNSFNNCNSAFQRKLKRTFDFVMSIGLFIVFIPAMILTYIIVKCDVGFKYIILNPMKIIKNPAFFKQKRIGFQGKEFEIIKFRSMKVHDPSKYSKYASENDDRITAVGHFIRKTRLDELPQVVNVIRGDMSFVGPRPEWNELGRKYEESIKNYRLRYAVRPGITGWAQTLYTYGASMDDAKVKLAYDLYYVKNQNFLLDMIILFKTCKTVLFGKGM